jgi:hypothetical protein
VKLKAESLAVEIRVIDAKLNVVAHAFGAMKTELLPGIYDVVFCLGTSVEREIIAVRPGVPVEREVRLNFFSAAPLPGTQFYRPEDAAGIRDLTVNRTCPPNHGELLICFRNLSDEAPPIDSSMLKGIELVDPNWNTVSSLETASGSTLCRTIILTLPDGGYALRHAIVDTIEGSADVAYNVDQALYVCAGWRTMVFVPVRRGGPDPSLASVHMMNVWFAWDMNDDHRVRVGIAAEAVLAAYRQGRNAFPPDVLRLARDNKADDPMLGLLAANSLLLEPSPDWKTLDSILSFLTTIPSHPDLLALRAIGIARRHSPDAKEPPVITERLSWPPMLLAPYREILQIDAQWPTLSVFVDDSAAECAAPQLLAQETWCAWEALPPKSEGFTAEVMKASEDGRAITVRLLTAAGLAVSSGFSGASVYLAVTALKLVGKSIAKRNWTRLVESITATDPSFEELHSYLTERVSMTNDKTLRSFLDKVNSEQERIRIGRATGLPSRSIEKALQILRTEIDKIEPLS